MTQAPPPNSLKRNEGVSKIQKVRGGNESKSLYSKGLKADLVTRAFSHQAWGGFRTVRNSMVEHPDKGGERNGSTGSFPDQARGPAISRTMNIR